MANFIEKDLQAIAARKQAAYQTAKSLASSQAGTDIKYINTGDTALDSQTYDQMMRDTQYLSTAKQLEQLGYNPANMFGSVASAGGASSAAVSSSATKKELEIAKQNADAASTTAKASMINAYANSAKAISTFLPHKNINQSITTLLKAI